VVPTGQASISLSDLLFSSGATAHIFSDVSFIHDQDAPVALPEDGSGVHLFVTVIAEDGTTALHYDVTAARAKAASSDAGLISVAGHAPYGSMGDGNSPSSPTILDVDTASGKPAITASDIVAAPGATVHIYPSSDYTHNEDGAVNLPEGGSAHLYIEVTAEDNVTTKYYDVTVNRAKTPSSDAGLTTIAGRPVTVTGAPTVGASVAAAVTVPSGQNSIGPSDIGSASGSVAHIYSDGGFSQNQDAPVTLNPGENHVYIAVTAEDGGTSFYDVTVTRESPRTAGSAPVPAPAPEPVPDPAADEPAASDSTYSSTNITFGGVSIDGGQHWQNLERQADGTWLVVVPWNTNLTNLALTFRLPNPATRLVPVNGTPEDFSDDRAVAYTVSSADGSNTAVYRIRAARRAFEVVDDVLLEPDGALWGLAAVWNGNGWSFTLTIPAAPSETSVTASHLPLQTYVSLDGYYTHVSLGLRDQNGEALSPFQMDSYVFAGRRDKPDALNVSAMAADLETLEGLLVDEVEWSFADEPGKSHRQYLNPPVTFDAIGDKTLVGPSGGSQRHGGGGCDGGLFPGALALALLPLLRKKRK
jgi:Synergist-CTERM protein sorting domain-containing protein